MKMKFEAEIDGKPYSSFQRNSKGEWVDDDGDTLPVGLSDALDELEAQLEDDPMNTLPAKR